MTTRKPQIDWFEEKARDNIGYATRRCVDGHLYLSVAFDGQKFRYRLSGEITREQAATFADEWWRHWQERFGPHEL